MLKCAAFLVFFDQAFNDRYFNNVTHQVLSRYLSSSFMGHSTAEGIMENFLEASSEMKMSNLLQLSMDGPSVNWFFLEKRTSNHHDEFNMTVLFLVLVVFTLSMLHLKQVTVKWKVQLLLRLFCKLFKDSPASRADYIDWTGSELFLKKFCSVPWVSRWRLSESISCIS